MTTNTTILATTPEIRAACDRIDDAVGRSIASINRALTDYAGWHRYEAGREAVKLFWLGMRSVEGVLALARSDLVLFPPAILAARGAFETLLKAAWMVDCDDPFDRELRWVAHLRSEERAWERAAKHSIAAGESGEWAITRHDQIKAFRLAVEQAFPHGYVQLPGLPSTEAMTSTLHDQRLYLMYTFMSQFMHGERIASAHYEPSAEPRLDAVHPSNWSIPLKVCWLSLVRAGRLLISRLEGDPDSFISLGEATEVEASLDAIDRMKSSSK